MLRTAVAAVLFSLLGSACERQTPTVTAPADAGPARFVLPATTSADPPIPDVFVLVDRDSLRVGTLPLPGTLERGALGSPLPGEPISAAELTARIDRLSPPPPEVSGGGGQAGMPLTIDGEPAGGLRGDEVAEPPSPEKEEKEEKEKEKTAKRKRRQRSAPDPDLEPARMIAVITSEGEEYPLKPSRSLAEALEETRKDGAGVGSQAPPEPPDRSARDLARTAGDIRVQPPAPRALLVVDASSAVSRAAEVVRGLGSICASLAAARGKDLVAVPLDCPVIGPVALRERRTAITVTAATRPEDIAAQVKQGAELVLDLAPDATIGAAVRAVDAARAAGAKSADLRLFPPVKQPN